MRRLVAKKGFTLVEVLMASVILIISLGGMLSLFFYCFSLNERSREYAMAIAEAQSKLEEMRSMASVHAEVFDLSLLTGKGVVYVRDTPIYPNPDPMHPELLEVKMVISWHSNRDGHIIGEDQDLNGLLGGGEDLNGNSELDSPIMLTTFLARRY